jgi:hypothetical protein
VDDNLRDVAIALTTVAGGFLTAFAVARITMGATRGLERDKWKRELYAAYIHSTNEVRDVFHQMATGTDPDPGWGAHMDHGQRLLLEIKMIAPDMRKPADAVWTAVAELTMGVFKAEQSTDTPAGRAVPLDLTRYRELDEAYRVAMVAFVERASEDLR